MIIDSGPRLRQIFAEVWRPLLVLFVWDVVVTGGYDRSRCSEVACAALPPLPVPEDAEPPPDSEALVAADTEGNFTRIHQLPNMRNIIVRNARTVSCWKMGFYCRPDDQARLLALLEPYNCSVHVGARVVV
jgi:hypothetical protein